MLEIGLLDVAEATKRTGDDTVAPLLGELTVTLAKAEPTRTNTLAINVSAFLTPITLVENFAKDVPLTCD
jgi:hypothetical protein